MHAGIVGGMLSGFPFRRCERECECERHSVRPPRRRLDCSRFGLGRDLGVEQRGRRTRAVGTGCPGYFSAIVPTDQLAIAGRV